MSLQNILLSILAIAVFSTYSLYEHAHQDSASVATLLMNDLASGSSNDLSAANPQPTSVQQPIQTTPQPTAQQAAPQAVATRIRGEHGEDGEYEYEYGEDDHRTVTNTTQPAPAPAQTQPTHRTQTQPAQQATPTPAPAPASTGQYKDGTYTGSTVNVYYGYVQVQAIVSGGKLADVKFLQYPSDRQTSQYINGQAMPMLIQEAVSAQSAQVSGVSGASATSQGFIESLGQALSQAAA